MKNGFIRKVYGIFTAQIIVTTLFVGYSMAVPEFVVWQLGHIGLLYTLLVLNMVAQCMLICNKPLARQVPINYFILGFITLSESYLLSIICSEYTPESVLRVFVLTSSAFIGMSFYAMTTKIDVTIFYSLTAGIVCLMFTTLIMLIFT